MDTFINRKARPEIFNLKPYIAGKPIEEVRRELGIEDIIKLASNENPFGPSPMAVEAIQKILTDIHFYPDSNNYNLKKKLAQLTKHDETGIIIGNGSDELLKLIAETFLNAGDEIITADPTFAEYEFTATIMGAKTIKVPSNNFVHDLEAMKNRVTNQTKLIVICNPNNPTGAIVTEEELDKFMAEIPEDLLVIFDEAYFEYVNNSQYVSGKKYVDLGKNVIVLRTFSKIYGLAGLRVGYGLTTPEIAGAIARVTEPFNVNLLAQIGATAAIDDVEHIEESRQMNLAGKEYLYQEFKALGLNYVETEANFIFVDTGKDCQEVFSKLLKLGIIIRTGDIFGYPTYIRVTIGSSEENKRFIAGLKTVLEA